ncbi:tetratricopeptide repeat protein [Armatimonas sp.]|uniref:tetratricopeptide repeat protein n=1 Tax=Armatimonas sp. TaxID=1872638 RepID=UPI003750DB9F
MMKNFLDAVRGNPKLAAGALALLAVQGLLQARIDPLRRQPAVEPPSVIKSTGGLPFEYSLAAISGFRQVIAGLLWVRADSFFHSGNYDAILPLLRLITWLDPNWLDVYATGAWHLMYNFTDTDQRSDRRYLPVGLALLNEGIAANSTVFDLYKEKGWNLFDKVKDYPLAADAYKAGRDADPNHDINQIEHLLAHCVERSGDPEGAIAAWADAMRRHKVLWDAAKGVAGKEDIESRNRQGYNNASKNFRIMKVRSYCRPRDIARLGPVEASMGVKVTRIRPRVLRVEGSWNLVGCLKDQYDDLSFDDKGDPKSATISSGIVMDGPVDGARVDVRLQNAGYVMPDSQNFSFEVSDDLTIMQDSLSSRGGRRSLKGTPYQFNPGGAGDQNLERAGIYSYKDQASAPKGISAAQALASGQISPAGQLQLVTYIFPPQTRQKKFYTLADLPGLMSELKSDPARMAQLETKKILVATEDKLLLSEFGKNRELDMSKDPKMYGFKTDLYDLIVSFSPRSAPDFVQDRLGWNGEGLKDKRYLRSDVKLGQQMLYLKLKLTKEDIMGTDKKVLFDDSAGIGLDRLQK